MERLPARCTLVIGRISEQFREAESGAFPVMAIPENDVTKDVPQLICNRLLRFKSQIPGKVSKIVQISTPEG